MSGANEYLVLFAHHNMYFNMRFQELEALASMHGIGSKAELYVDDPPPTALVDSPLVRVRFPGGAATARAICERSVLIKAVLEVWGTGDAFPEAIEHALKAPAEDLARRREVLTPPRTFQIKVVTFGRTQAMANKREIIESLRPLFTGDELCDLKDPHTTIWALEENCHRTDEKTHLGPRSGEEVRTAIIGRQVAGGRSVDKKTTTGEKCFFHDYELSKRAVLGPTTMENELAFIMANCGCARSGSVAMDPFGGTGGLLVALAHFGARVVGGEIDIRVAHGYRIAYINNAPAAKEADASSRRFRSSASRAPASATQQESGARDQGLTARHLSSIGLASATAMPARATTAAVPTSSAKPHLAESCKDIYTNFLQYDLALPEYVLCDMAALPWRPVSGGWVDSIVTDPPYGVRAGAKKQGREAGHHHKEVKDKDTYIPSKVSYDLDEISLDLMSFAATALRDGGRLVVLVPVDLADFLGIDRAAERGAAGGPRGKLRDAAMPDAGRTKDPRLCISETTRDPRLLDEGVYADFLPVHCDLEFLGASLQVLSGGLGRLLVTFRRRPRQRP